MRSNLDSMDIAFFTSVIGIAIGCVVWLRQNSNKPKESPKQVSLSELKASMGSGSRSLVQKLESMGNEKMVILVFGSQTGTAEDLALRTQKEISVKLNVPTVVIDPEEYDMSELTQWKDFSTDRDWVIGFFMATYGEGEPTDNCTEFYSWIMDGQGLGPDKGEDDDEMTADKVCRELNFFTFGLGNTTYEFYNAIAKRLGNRLIKLGAKRIGEAGEGDDDGSLEDDYLQWLPKIIGSLSSHFGISIDTSATKDAPHIPLFNIHYTQSPSNVYKGEQTTNKPRTWEAVGGKYVESGSNRYDVKYPFYSKVNESKALFRDSLDKFTYPGAKIVVNSSKANVKNQEIHIPRQCYHIEFDLSDSGLTYKTGDHVGVWGNNSDASVKKLAKFLNVANLDALVELIPNKENRLSENAKVPFPQPCSIKDILTHYLDINAVLKQHHFEILSKYAADPKEKDVLYSFAEDREHYLKFIEVEQKTLACVLEQFTSVKLPLEVALGEIFRTISVRYYSISSSSLEKPSTLTVTAVVVRYALQQSRPHDSNSAKVVLKEGLATSSLERVHEQFVGSSTVAAGGLPPLHVPLYIRPSTFRLPKDNTKPIVMVGPGTGVAPFRGFIRERVLLARKGETVGPTWLFFGCRSEASDYLYSDEFQQLTYEVQESKLKIDLRVITAFSRDGNQKVYVQHRIKEHSASVWNLLEHQKGHFYICGDAKHMAADVNQELEKMAISAGGLSESEAKNWVKKLKLEGRYSEDVWA